MKIRYKRRALEDLESIHSYIAQFDREAAKRVIGRIERVIGRLAYLPCTLQDAAEVEQEALQNAP